MKRCILILLWLATAATATAQNTGHKGKATITPQILEQSGDSLRIQIGFDLNDLRVRSRQSIRFIPTLTDDTTCLTLPAVEAKGRTNYLISKRKALLAGQRPVTTGQTSYAVVKGYGKESAAVDYRLGIPFEPWMRNARLGLTEELCGCGNAPRTVAVTELGGRVTGNPPAATPFRITPALAYLRPAAEAVKTREVDGQVFLDFEVSKTNIRPDYMRNPEQLSKLTAMIKELQNDPSISVRSIRIIGFASPEGTYKFNRYLSKARAEALANYLSPHFNFPREMYHTEFGGENWAGLQRVVEQSDMRDKERILHILATVPARTDDQPGPNPKNTLKELNGGDTYRHMLKEFYPSLRTSSCRIGYEIKPFETAEALEIYRTHPEQLNLEELYRIANTYQTGSPEFVDVFRTAARLFPDDEAANLNAAAAALAGGDNAQAAHYMQHVHGDMPEALNLRGVMYLLAGNYDQATEALTRAAKAGLHAAEENLTQLRLEQEHDRQPGQAK